MATPNALIENFLQSVCKFIATEETAQDIRDELSDHITSSISSHLQDGLDEEAATTKALQQMGDPTALSLAYKEKFSLHTRLITVLQLGSLIALWCCFCVYDNFFIKFSWLNIFICLMLIISYGLFICALLKTHHQAKLLAQKAPIFYIQSYNKTTLNEWLLKVIYYFFLISIVLILIAAVVDYMISPTGNLGTYMLHTIQSLLPFSFLCTLYSMLLHSRTPNVAYEDGILTFLGFFPWNDMKCYRFNTETIKNETCYSLEIKLQHMSFISRSVKGSSSPVTIKVSQSQKELVAALFDIHHVPYSRHM